MSFVVVDVDFICFCCRLIGSLAQSEHLVSVSLAVVLVQLLAKLPLFALACDVAGIALGATVVGSPSRSVTRTAYKMAILQLCPVLFFVARPAAPHTRYVVAVYETHIPAEYLVKARPQSLLRWFWAFAFVRSFLRAVPCFGFWRPFCH